MATNWTSEQRQVIDTRNKDILVSAAAGSGKTAVLVERIITKVTDAQNPVNIDEILLLTFTNAAAAEMKNKVRKALDKAALENPDNQHILKQPTLIHNAQVKTIDGFCGYLVKNYFYRIGIDPGYRVGSNGELCLMQDEVFSELLSQKLESDFDSVKQLVDTYCDEKGALKLLSMVKTIARKASADPWPKEYIDGLKDRLCFESLEQIKESEYVKHFFDGTKSSVWYAVDKCNYLRNEILPNTNGVDKYLENVDSDYEKLLYLAKAEDLNELTQRMSEFRFDALSRKKPQDPEACEYVKTLINEYRDYIKDLVKKHADFDIKREYSYIKYMQPIIVELLDFTADYMDALLEKKKKSGVYDFSDIEHFALDIVIDPVTHQRTEVADELRAYYKEVMVDEYQDSNQLQEAILLAICNDAKGHHNYFMVGDVKQSIYAFRQAKPDIFIEKYNSFGDDDSVKIDLHKNFRSRSQVLDFCNVIFDNLMKKDLGGVEYDQDARLVYGDLYKNSPSDNSAEILICDELEAEDIEDGADALEAEMVASKIRQMMDNQMVAEKDDFRKLRYSDIAILMRSTGKHADTFVKILDKHGIPAYVESEKGYFDSMEVSIVLSMLRVLDNPYQDIPLMAVLRSPMFDIDDNTLAEIKLEHSKQRYYLAVFDYIKEHPDNKKLLRFYELVSAARKMAIDRPVHEIILYVLEQTDFMNFVYSIDGGRRRYQNLEKLVSEAIKFEKSNYSGLSDFVRYIDDLIKYDEELGMAKIVSKNEDAVAIMTMHKSKGLEFPVCFVSCTSDKFNDKSDIVDISDKFGIAVDYRNADRMEKATTLLSRMVVSDRIESSHGEEMRILYVALTRAKEKLIVTGRVKDIEKTISNWKYYGHQMSYTTRLSASSHLQWIITSLCRLRQHYPITIVDAKQLILEDAVEQEVNLLTKEYLELLAENVDKATLESLQEIYDFKYPYEASKFKNKYSVSELKHRAIDELLNDESQEAEVTLFDTEQSSDKVSRGALYGTATHRFFECFDFSLDNYATAVDSELLRIRSAALMSEEEMELLKVDKLKAFAASELAGRMHEACIRGELFKEQPFVFMSDAKSLLGRFDENIIDDEEEILVQGIIDAYFIEDGQIVIMDYKTDNVDTPNDLVLRYQEQLDLYEQAMQRAYDIPVKEKVIYSFKHDTMINL